MLVRHVLLTRDQYVRRLGGWGGVRGRGERHVLEICMTHNLPYMTTRIVLVLYTAETLFYRLDVASIRGPFGGVEGR